MPNYIQLKLEDKTLDYIVQVLQSRPWGEVNPVLQDILKQANNQPKEAQNGPDASTAG